MSLSPSSDYAQRSPVPLSAIRGAPTLTTSRLTLRAPTMADWPAFADFHASPRSELVGGPRSPEDAWSLFSANAGHWALKGFGWFTIDDGTGPQGMAGVHHPPQYAAPELAWLLYDPALGKGYATEAAATARDWALQAIRRATLVSYIDADNLPSQAVARRLGATPTGARAAHDPDCEIWIHPTETDR